MYICVTVNINESARPLVLMVTLAECDVLIDLVWSFLFLLESGCKVRGSGRLQGNSLAVWEHRPSNAVFVSSFSLPAYDSEEF